ncbi:MAG: VWA domain-containing protein [Acidobacteria bacterium]|nr:VWA domain-containing protein [Acidobacteriota bacterium]
MSLSKLSRIGFSFLLAELPLSSQQIPEPTIKVEVSVVNVLCAVRDNKGRLVSNLEKSDFEIREDGKPQQITYFSRETQLPLTLGLLVDSSISQQRLIEEEREAAASFFEQVLRKDDMAFLINFDINVNLLQDVTGSVDFLRQALADIRVTGGGGSPNSGPFPSSTHTGGTRLYDAVYLASQDVLGKEVGRKALVLITDGQDHGSKVDLERAVEAAQRTDSIVYGILFMDRGFYGFGGAAYQGESVLKEMAEETGGRVFRAGSRQELTRAFDQISEELRSQYSLGYSPTNTAHNRSFRRIEIKVHRNGHRIQARKGYYPSGG